LSDEITFILQIALSGVVTGSLYSILALGFVLIYKASDVLNFATGEIMMLGAYFFYTFNGLFNLPFWLSFLLVLIISVLVALFIERLCLRRLIGEPVISIIMVTLGIGVFIKSIIELAWGPLTRSYPAFFSGDLIEIGRIVLSPLNLIIIVFAWITIIILLLFFKFTRLGLEMRGTADRQGIALMLGVNVDWIFALSWAIAVGVASAAGIFFAYSNVLNPHLHMIGIGVLPVVILGGIDSIGGAIVGGIIVGVITNLASAYLGQYMIGIDEMFPYVILLLVLMFRPYGLFGSEEIERV
jgi:branched-chain amino acid transport system permease protein